MIISIVETLIFLLCIVLSVAYLTVGERKTLGYTQRRLGPNSVGYYGSLMCFADALKLLIKEIVIPMEANLLVIILSPMITLASAFLGWGVMPFGPSIVIGDISNGLLYYLAIGSVGIFGVLLAGWSSNSKYSLIGSIRSTAQLISYELVITTIVIICIMFVSNLNMTSFVESQRGVWYFIPLLPLFILFYIASVAETNRPPFDNVEAESELVSGYFTEYSGAPFVFFYLAEYSNIMLICVLNVILFIGGYLSIHIISEILSNDLLYKSILLSSLEGATYGISLSIKTIILMFTFIWVRSSFPRLRYDLLINFCWLVILPLVFSLVIIIPSVLFFFNSLPTID